MGWGMKIRINAGKQGKHESTGASKSRKISNKEVLSAVKRNVKKKQALLERLRNV